MGDLYEFRVQLGPDCYRVIQCSGNHTFDDFHRVIQVAFAFDDDHLYSFFMDGKRWSDNSIKSPRDGEPPSAGEVRIYQANLREKQKFLYLFDYGDEWLFQITVTAIRETDTIPLRPQIVKSLGESPEQYPDMDDDDEWDDDDDDDDDDEWDDDDDNDGE